MAASIGVLGLAGCGGGSGGSGGGASVAGDGTFLVIDDTGAPIVGATVYLVPAGDVDDSPITATQVRIGAAVDRDEPLEDPVRLNGSSYPHATTGADGKAFVQDILDIDYFWYVEPAAGDTEHLPGGSSCRFVKSFTDIVATTSTIQLSSRPGASAFYRGTSTCLVCHSGLSIQATHAHRLGLSRPGQFGTLQDPTRYPDFTGGWDLFLSAATHTGGTLVTATDFDPTRGTDKFKTFLSSPTGTTYLRVWLWKDTADAKFKITLENAINPADPATPRTLEVALTYGGALFRQLNLVKVPGRKGIYPLLQWQSEGDEARFDRTRKVFRDYHLDHFWNNATLTLKDPPINANFDANCTACHATGFQRYQDPMTGEWLTDAVDEVTGEYDLNHDGTPDEINMGCESCHGPGSDHVTWAADPANVGMQRRFIVNPAHLGPSRLAMVCGRCHDRVTGNWSVMANEEPLNAAGEMALPGISREEWLANYTSVPGPGPADVWDDDLHSKNYHQQYSDLIKSKMHRNDRILTVCIDCHDEHGFGAVRAPPEVQSVRLEQPAVPELPRGRPPVPHDGQDRLHDGGTVDAVPSVPHASDGEGRLRPLRAPRGVPDRPAVRRRHHLLRERYREPSLEDAAQEPPGGGRGNGRVRDARCLHEFMWRPLPHRGDDPPEMTPKERRR